MDVVISLIILMNADRVSFRQNRISEGCTTEQADRGTEDTDVYYSILAGIPMTLFKNKIKQLI